MIERSGILSQSGFLAACVVCVDEDTGLYISDESVNPPVPDGNYDLEIQYREGVKRHLRFVRTNGIWKELIAQGE